MGAAISSTLSLGMMYCVCNAVGSMCNACLGSTSPGTTGRRRSVLLLTLAIALALWFQYDVGPAIVTKRGWAYKSSWIPYMGQWLYAAWHEPCAQYDPTNSNNNNNNNNNNNDNDNAQLLLLEQCAGQAGVFRPMAVATLHFVLSAMITKHNPDLNRQIWPAKFGVFGIAVVLSLFVNSSPLFTGLYLWIARLGATVFLLFQQVILIDLAYNWNEDWVDRADQADRVDYGSGQAWLQFIVATCAGFYALALIGIGLLYHLFDACPANTWIITLSLLGIVAFTVIQLSGNEGSLLTSSILAVYTVYLAYSMVSKNPMSTCNPYLGHNDRWGIAIGLTLTAVSLAWLGWSWTAEERLSNPEAVQTARPLTNTTTTHTHTHNNEESSINLDVPFLDPDDMPTSGLLVDGSGNRGSSSAAVGADVWKLNVVMALICCFVSMTLTGWGSLNPLVVDEQQEPHSNNNMNAANPTIGRMNMAMIGISQWTCIGLYIWTLLAPRIFPDRDFS